MHKYGPARHAVVASKCKKRQKHVNKVKTDRRQKGVQRWGMSVHQRGMRNTGLRAAAQSM